MTNPKIKADDIRIVHKRRVYCEGGPGKGLGHPRVYLDMGQDSQVTCPYCGRIFMFAQSTQEDRPYSP